MCAECLLLQCICSRLAGFRKIAETKEEREDEEEGKGKT